MPRLIRLATPAALALLIASTAQAQMSVGLRGGLSYAELAGDQISTDPKTGFVAGAYVGIKISGNWVVMPEASYVQKGAKVEGFEEATGEPLTVTTDIDYVELLVPVGINLAVESESVQPRLYAGPTLGFALRCKIDPDTGETPSDCKDSVKSTDFGLVFGIGVELGSGPGAFLADLRYDYGIADINDTEDDITNSNRSLQLLVGYRRHF